VSKPLQLWLRGLFSLAFKHDKIIRKKEAYVFDQNICKGKS